MASAPEATELHSEPHFADDRSTDLQQEAGTPAEADSPRYAPALSGAWWLLLIAMVAALAKWLF